MIADDDTIIGVSQLLALLQCYDANDPVALGQRYGFRVASGRYGYDYATGGAGMIFNRAAVARVAEACRCPFPDTPDDMFLGSCLASLGFPLTHNARFHQGRPEDYAQELLESPISFHKFWNTDPKMTYETFFAESDRMLREQKYNLLHPHQEL